MDEMIGADHGEFVDKLLDASLEAHSSTEERRHLAEAWKMYLRRAGKLRPSQGDADGGRAGDDDLLAMFAFKSPDSRDRSRPEAVEEPGP